VLRLARLLATVESAVELAFNPESGTENEGITDLL